MYANAKEENLTLTPRHAPFTRRPNTKIGNELPQLRSTQTASLRVRFLRSLRWSRSRNINASLIYA
jgi:hypothetical protein